MIRDELNCGHARPTYSCAAVVRAYTPIVLASIPFFVQRMILVTARICEAVAEPSSHGVLRAAQNAPHLRCRVLGMARPTSVNQMRHYTGTRISQERRGIVIHRSVRMKRQQCGAFEDDCTLAMMVGHVGPIRCS